MSQTDTTPEMKTIESDRPRRVPVSYGDPRFPEELLLSARRAVLDGETNVVRDVVHGAPRIEIGAHLFSVATGQTTADVYAPPSGTDDPTVTVERSIPITDGGTLLVGIEIVEIDGDVVDVVVTSRRHE